MVGGDCDEEGCGEEGCGDVYMVSVHGCGRMGVVNGVGVVLLALYYPYMVSACLPSFPPLSLFPSFPSFSVILSLV